MNLPLKEDDSINSTNVDDDKTNNDNTITGVVDESYQVRIS